MSSGPFADFQNEVYLKGLFGELPMLRRLSADASSLERRSAVTRTTQPAMTCPRVGWARPGLIRRPRPVRAGGDPRPGRRR